MNVSKNLFETIEGKKFDNVYIESKRIVGQNFYGKKIVIGMGAGSISSWMRELPKLIR